jgi:putative endonuclease
MAVRGDKAVVRTITPRQLLWKLSDRVRQFRQNQTLPPQAALGRRGEDLAHRYLRSSGYMVVARNYRPANGEVEADIVARQGEYVVFVEVKSRTSGDFGSPDRAIGSDKQKNIVRAARAYATRAGIEWSHVRFDTISIVFTDPPSITHLKDAFFEDRSI